MRLGSSHLAVLCFLLASTSATPAFADMGRAPTGHGTYVSGEGGYLLFSENDGSGYGISSSGLNFTNVFVSPEDGWFAGGMI